MNRFHGLILLCLAAMLAGLTNPVLAAQEQNVVASAVVRPARISEMAFLISGPVKEIVVEEGDQVTAGQTLAMLNAPELEYNVLAAEAAFRAAQAYAKLQRYKRVKDRRHGRVFWDVVPPEVRQKADAEAARSQASLEIAQASLAQAALVAPYDATVAAIDVVPGEYVEQNQVVVTLATLDHLQVETTDLSERDITKVKIGAPVDIFIAALNQNVSGRVTGISPIADRVGGDVVFRVVIALDRQPENLLWGMTAEVTIGK